MTPRIPPGGRRRAEAPGICLLAGALAWNAILLWPELRLDTIPLNDLVFHRAAAERLSEALARGEPFLDPWVSEWSLGYPVWRSYQPLPHLVAALALRAAAPLASADAVFAGLHYALLVLLPLSAYLGTRLLGLRPAAAGLASCLLLLPAAEGELGRYGLGYGATTWRGSGLYTQLFALHLLFPFLGLVARALDTGRRRAVAALLLALTALSHIVFGYVAGISAAVLAVVGEKGGRARRLVRLATIAAPAALLLLWFVVPLLVASGEVNHSRWEDPHKWDSFGAPRILREIATGSFFDAGRPPVLSLALLVGLAVAIAAARREALARRLLALAAVWLLLFFGRATWGHLLLFAGVPRDLHLHRLQAAFELSAILAAAFGLERLLRWAMPRRALVLAGGAALLALLFPAILERARYLRQQVPWGTATLVGWEAERSHLDAAIAEVRRILAERPGRVTAGKAATWGKDFKIGSVPIYAFLARHHLDSPSFLYHSMSLTSDIMVLREENDRAHDVAFGVRAAIAPAEHAAPAHWRLRARHGRFAVHENSPEGYFGLVDIGAVYEGPRAGWYDANSAWLGSSLLRQGIVAALGRQQGAPESPGFGRWEPIPAPAAPLTTYRGRVVSESKQGEVYRAQLDLVRPCFAFVKITYHPGLVARVDGSPAPIVRVTPGFGAVPVPAGVHEIEVRYRPGPLKPALFALGLAAFGAWAWALRAGRLARLAS